MRRAAGGVAGNAGGSRGPSSPSATRPDALPQLPASSSSSSSSRPGAGRGPPGPLPAGGAQAGERGATERGDLRGPWPLLGRLRLRPCCRPPAEPAHRQQPPTDTRPTRRQPCPLPMNARPPPFPPLLLPFPPPQGAELLRAGEPAPAVFLVAAGECLMSGPVVGLRDPASVTGERERGARGAGRAGLCGEGLCGEGRGVRARPPLTGPRRGETETARPCG